MSEKTSSLKLIPVMLAFFAMGFVDLVGIASNYLKADLGLSDSEANIFPSLVFFWFLIFSVPTGMLMNRIGRKKTVLLSLIVTFLSLMIPIFDDAYMVMLISFSLLGIGNALMQTSLNPFFDIRSVREGDRLLLGALYRYVGGYPSDTVDGTRLACLVSGLYGDRRDRYPAIGSYHYP